MTPSPETAMFVTTIVSLEAITQRLGIENAIIEANSAVKYRVGMWSAGESNPSLTA